MPSKPSTRQPTTGSGGFGAVIGLGPVVAVLLAVLGLIGVGAYLVLRSSLPRPGSAEYEQVTRAFYRGLAALEVGLLDDARDQFARATELVPDEPASWANLGLAGLRLGDADGAAPAIERALQLAPDRADVLMLASRLESARGQLDPSVSLLRRAVAADATDLRARFALVEELDRAGLAETGDEVPALLDGLIGRVPSNLAVLVERARMAARRADAARARDSVMRIDALSTGWPAIALEQLGGLRQAVGMSQWPDAVRSAALLRNVLARVPAFGESLAQVRTPAELVGQPLTRFAALEPPMAQPSEPDVALTFAAEPLGAVDGISAVLALYGPDGGPTLAAAGATGLRRMDGSASTLASWPAGTAGRGALTLDWNHDFRSDVVAFGSGGVRLFLQEADGTLADQTPASESAIPTDVAAAWAADVEMDGDLDLILGVTAGPTTVLRNNGDGTWRPMPSLGAVSNARAFAWADLDGDGDPDGAFLDANGSLTVLFNRQAGVFSAEAVGSGLGSLAALTVADLDADGAFEVLLLGRDGVMSGAVRGADGWMVRGLTEWDAAAGALEVGQARVLAGDLDNNGALDLVASTATTARAWLARDAQFEELAAPLGSSVAGTLDLTGDGTLDLFGIAGGQPIRWVGKGSRGYHWKIIRVQAQQNAGDQRINSFGIGGEIEVRSGLLWQKQPIAGPMLHFGLGDARDIDVARVVWPNGIPQAEFAPAVDSPLVAEQRLKGSCPWVFANDGREVRFVTDFLWRSPLGLRINAQDTAGVVQTEDWVRIGGNQLAPVGGVYDLRITAELWETHFFDHVSLLVVDHAPGTEVFVDERFSAARPPALGVHTVRELRALSNVRDEQRDVTALVAARDGRSVAGFAKGAYQGIAREHFVEFDLPADTSAAAVLVAQGWVYPTDSSINMAIGQGAAVRPGGLALEAQVNGRWRVLDPDIGFPAGKNKTMIVDLEAATGASRLRLRTNLEVYWDRLAIAERVSDSPRTTRLAASRAELRYRGFSTTTSPRGDRPETPAYERIAGVTQRWRDLEGYYTRFGDVKPLLDGVDDRYVIMNAGDELRLRFPEQPAPSSGWQRDFVLIGDGWEKDGDYNTGHSQTVLPLPDHATPDYGAAAVAAALEDDPVYKRHPDDWQQFHTRYVTPQAFLRGTRP